MTITKAILERQCKDLRLRLRNQEARFDLKTLQYNEHIEVLNRDLRDMPGQIKMLQRHITVCEANVDALSLEIQKLKKENCGLLEMNEKLNLVIERLKATLNKDSSNSDKPPSTDIYVKPKPQSLREKSGKKPGGQPGHVGHGPKLFENPTNVIEHKPCRCGNCGAGVKTGEEYARRQVVDLTINVEITEERVFKGICPDCGKAETAKFSSRFRGPLQYGPDIKAFVSMLGAYGAVSDSKAAEIINSISGGILNTSPGTVVNIRRELSERLEDTINMIREQLILSGVLNADESGVRVNGKLTWGHVFCNSRFALFDIGGRRGDVDEGANILAYFTGILVHDHFMSYYRFKTMTHAECNQHILRYLKGLVEIFKHEWFTEMTDLLKSMCHEKNELMRAGKLIMPPGDIEKYSKQYDEVLKKGWSEYKSSTQGDNKKEKYYNDERCLLTRLKEYKKEHLLFIEDFNVPFTNNGAEHCVRGMKVKQRVSGCFRSADGADWYARIMSLITSLRKQNLLVFEGIRSVFLGQAPFSSA
jgi:transposase